MANSTIRVAVMGATGTGKSTFVKLLTNDDKICIGHGQESETFDVQTSTYTDHLTRRSVMLIDTPGFDDSRDGVTDTDILEKIVQFLEPISGERQKLNGIIYMHRISDPRVGGVSRKNLRVFHSLCGDENLKNVRIVTTNWDRVGEAEGNRREIDLKNGAFKALIDAGAQMRRHTNTVQSAHQILSELIPLQAVMIQVQIELHDGKKLADTVAGTVLVAEMAEMQKSHERKMVELKKEVEVATKVSDQGLRAKTEQERRVLDGRIARANADRANLERMLEERRRAERVREEERQANIMRVNEQLAQQRREAQAQRDKADAVQRQLRENALQKQLELQRQIAETNRRAAELQASHHSDSGGCVIS